ncbi:hypothetical protein EBN88_29210, partial [Streptomyces triticirhizae]
TPRPGRGRHGRATPPPRPAGGQRPPQGPPFNGAQQAAGPGQGAPGAPDEGATELIPLVTDRYPNDAATELIPPVTADAPETGPGSGPRSGSGNEDATELIPPVVVDEGPTPGAVGNPEETTRLRAIPPRQPGRHRSPQQARQPQDPTGGVEATQALPPVQGDFDQLFRSAADRQPPPPPAGWSNGGPAGGGWGGQPPEPERRRNPKLLVGGVIAGCAVVGLLAGYLLSGGDGGEDSDGGVPPEAQAEDTGGSGGEEEQNENGEAGGADENDEEAVRAQAESLSELLADSNDSRDSVIRSVANIRECRQLEAAATDLRAAADQRTGLVDRLNELTLDQLPDSQELITALTEAWQASAEADEHYAAWADEARANRGQVCRGGQAQHTQRASEGDAASGRATEAKERAAELWNPLAGRYDLPERAATQL